MSDPVKPAATGSAQPANPVVPPVQTTDKKEEGGTPTRFEAHVDGQGRIGDAFVVGAGAGFLAFPWLYAGGKFQSNFSTRPWSVAAEVGPRFKVGDTVSIQPTLVAGVQKVSGEETKQGPLAEKVKLDGINFFFNPQVRLLIEPVNPSGIGGFLAIGMHIEPRGGLDATPASLKSGENPTSNVLTPNFGIGITWGAKPKKASSPTEEPRKSEPEVSPDTKKQEPKKESFKEKVDTKTAAVTAGMDKDRAEKLKAQINKISEKVTRLKARITNMGEGINRSNQIVQSVDETTDTLVDFNKGKTTKEFVDLASKAAESDLDRLITATELGKDSKPVANDSLSEQIRFGMLFVYTTTANDRRYGEGALVRLDELRKQLNAQKDKNTALISKVEKAMSQLANFLKEYPDPYKVEDLQTEATELDGTIKGLESIESENNLKANPNWVSLRQDIDTAKQEAAYMTRELDALRFFANIFLGPKRNFADQVKDPATADATFKQAIDFVTGLSSNPKYEGVTIAKLRDRYSHFFKSTLYNADHFIKLHTPPMTTDGAQRRQWFASVQKAYDLICKIDVNADRCHTTLENPPKATSYTPPAGTGTGTKPVTPPPATTQNPPSNPPADKKPKEDGPKKPQLD